MCSNRAIVDSLECYMDDLVQCFEDFVKKSLIVISFGMGLIVAMLFYLLKMICERQPIRNISSTESTIDAHNLVRNMLVPNVKCDESEDNRRNMLKESGLADNDNIDNRKTTSVNTASIYPMPSYDEEILRDIGLSSCSKPGCKGRSGNQQQNIYTPSRVPISTLAASPPKHKSNHSLRSSKHILSSPRLYSRTIEKQGSCSSLCCDKRIQSKTNH